MKTFSNTVSIVWFINMSQKSWVWNHFNHFGSKAICHICETDMSCKGGSTTSLKRHLKKKHAIVRLNPTDNDRISRTEPHVSAKREEEINLTLAKIIAVNQLPISFCSSPGGELFAGLFPGYKMIKEEAMKRRLLLFKENISLKIKSEIKDLEFVSLTTDLWTSLANDSYLSVTAHFINKEWQLNTYLLDTTLMPDKHTAENITAKMNEVFRDWISCKISAVVSDNASNITNAIRNLDNLLCKDNVTCTAHTVQLVINGILKNPDIKQIVEKASKIVGHFKHSTLATNALKEKQKLLDIPLLKLLQCNKTRWNSTYIMLDRLIKNRTALMNVLADRNVTNQRFAVESELSEVEWSKIELIKDILEAHYLLTDILCSNRSSISIIRPTLNHWVEEYLNTDASNDDLSISIKADIKADLEKRFNLTCSANVTTRMLAPFFDPRYKDLQHETLFNITQIERTAKDLLRKEEPTSSGSASTLPPKTCAMDKFFNRTQCPVISLDMEWSRYRREETIDVKECPFKWWKEKEAKYPNISRMAKQFLCIPATSAESERSFSTAGNVVTAKRSSLKPSNVNTLVFLNHNRGLLI